MNYTKFKLLLTVLTVIAFVISLTPNTFAANIYVDQKLSSNCLDGNYSSIDRSCTGSDGKAYRSLQEALDSMAGGDDIYLRGGTYTPTTSNDYAAFQIPPSKSGSSENWSSIQSYPGEWAILDGQHTEARGTVLGYHSWGAGPASALRYWKFERLEVKNGGKDGIGAGIAASKGPIIVRYCYIHDNLASTQENLPAGLYSNEPEDSIVEYNYFKDNGCTGSHGNDAHINFIGQSDTEALTTAKYGYDPSRNYGGVRRNIVRYNLFEGGGTAVHYKISTLFSGRNRSGVDYGDQDSLYKTYGDHIHNNIIVNPDYVAIMMYQDFAQVYNNIIDGGPIWVQKRLKYGHYKVSIWNNTFRNIGSTSNAICRHEKLQLLTNSNWNFDQNTDHYGYDFNNIIEGGGKSAPAGVYEIVNFAPYHSTGQPYEHDFSNSIHTHTLFVNPGNDKLFRHYNISYNQFEYEANGPTSLPREIFVVENRSPFQGATGSGKYKTKADFLVEGSDSISNAGYKGNHPYLKGVIIPSYLGATNPLKDSGMGWDPSSPDFNDSGWVDYVLSLSNINQLQDGKNQAGYNLPAPDGPWILNN
jgi:hypothetical protein